MKAMYLHSSLLILAVATASVSRADSTPAPKPAGSTYTAKAPSSSETMNSVAQGAWTVDLAAQFSNLSASGGGGSISTSAYSVVASYFVTGGISVGLSYAYINDGVGDSDIAWGAEARYYIGASPEKTLVPFIGVLYSDDTSSSFTSWGGEIGFDYFVAKNVSLTPRVVYTTGSSDGVTLNDLAEEIGFTIWFK